MDVESLLWLQEDKSDATKISYAVVGVSTILKSLEEETSAATQQGRIYRKSSCGFAREGPSQPATDRQKVDRLPLLQRHLYSHTTLHNSHIIVMVNIHQWDEFQKAAEELYLLSPKTVITLSAPPFNTHHTSATLHSNSRHHNTLAASLLKQPRMGSRWDAGKTSKLNPSPPSSTLLDSLCCEIPACRRKTCLESDR
jgi:hypothetical protein